MEVFSMGPIPGYISRVVARSGVSLEWEPTVSRPREPAVAAGEYVPAGE
jgi:hypothetical protein